MTIFRYRVTGPTVENLKRYVDPNISSVNNIRRQVDSEIDLQDLEELGSLDSYMGTLGYQRVSGPEATGLLTSDLFSFGALSITDSGLQFLLPFGIAAALDIEIQAYVIGTRRFRTIAVQATSAGTGTGNITYTLRKNGGNTGLALITAVTSTQGINTSSEETFNNGDLISLSVDKGGGTILTTPVNIMVTIG